MDLDCFINRNWLLFYFEKHWANFKEIYIEWFNSVYDQNLFAIKTSNYSNFREQLKTIQFGFNVNISLIFIAHKEKDKK